VTYDPSQPYTFVIDPIDGTLAFTCGTPGWAICVGVLDSALRPVAGIISAPSWDSLFVADLDPQSPATSMAYHCLALRLPSPSIITPRSSLTRVCCRRIRCAAFRVNAAALVALLCTCVWWPNRAVLRWRTPVRCIFGTLPQRTRLPHVLGSPCSISIGRHSPTVHYSLANRPQPIWSRGIQRRSPRYPHPRAARALTTA
jgi:hypothetical protein